MKKKTLILNVKTEYFNQIKSGEKVHEFREKKPYWIKRLQDRDYDNVEIRRGYPKAGDTEKILYFPWNGYEKKTITHKQFGSDPVEVFAIILQPEDKKLTPWEKEVTNLLETMLQDPPQSPAEQTEMVEAMREELMVLHKHDGTVTDRNVIAKLDENIFLLECDKKKLEAKNKSLADAVNEAIEEKKRLQKRLTEKIKLAAQMAMQKVTAESELEEFRGELDELRDRVTGMYTYNQLQASNNAGVKEANNWNAIGLRRAGLSQKQIDKVILNRKKAYDSARLGKLVIFESDDISDENYFFHVMCKKYKIQVVNKRTRLELPMFTKIKETW